MGDLDEGAVAHAKGRLGTIVRGKYRLDRILGIGGMAVVYAATHRNQQEFAVKMLHAELSVREDVRSRFLREGYVANSVKHPGAVKVIDDDIADDGTAFLVMELLDGASVEELAERHDGKLPLDAVLATAYRLLDVLASAHAKAIVHRDIKPANVFITREGSVKVLDFGIARLRGSAVSSATHTGMLMGTPAFMAPEQALGDAKRIDGKTDIWAVGATMFTLLSAEIVHPADNAQQIMIRAATQSARSLAATRGNFPQQVLSIVDRALQTDNEKRFRGAAEMRDAVRTAYEELCGESASTRPLTALFAPVALGSGLTVHSETTRPAPVAVAATRPSDHSLPSSRELSESEQPAPAATAGAGKTTTQPVASEHPEPVVLPTISTRLGFVLVGVIALVGAAGAFVVRSQTADAPAPQSVGLVMMTSSSAAAAGAAPPRVLANTSESQSGAAPSASMPSVVVSANAPAVSILTPWALPPARIPAPPRAGTASAVPSGRGALPPMVSSSSNITPHAPGNPSAAKPATTMDYGLY